MKNPQSRCLPRGGSSVLLRRTDDHRTVTEPTNPAQSALPVTVAKFWRNRHRRESVVPRLREFEGVPLVDLRIFETGPDGIDRPTKQGLALSIRRLPALAHAFAIAYTDAQRLGLFGSTVKSS